MRGWTPEQLDYLEKNYGKIPTKELANHVGKKVSAVIQYANKNGISANRYFSDKEIEFIEKNIRRMNYTDIDKALNRPIGATKRYCYKNGIQKCELEDCLKLAEVARLAGVDRSTISRTWVKHGLTVRKSGKTSLIKISTLLTWMKQHPERWNATRCESWFFQQYPEIKKIFNNKRKEDFQKLVKSRWGENAS